MEGPNRGKRSIGLALENPDAQEILQDLIRTSDVFLTNFLPGPRRRLHIELEDVRKINPDIIYVRGSGFGNKGPEREKGGYDSTCFWARAGSASGVTPPDLDRMMAMPAGAYGDNIGGMTIAGGIAAALYARKATGQTSVIDVSLLSVGAWATQFSTNLALLVDGPLPLPKRPKHGSPTNPLIGSYRTADNRWIELSMLQPGRYWPDFCRVVGRPELAEDERFSDTAKIMKNAPEAAEIVAKIIAQRTYTEWLEILTKAQGQWAAVQEAYEVGHDVSLRANGYIGKVIDADGEERELVVNPVQFDETPPKLTRAPQFAEHTDQIIRDLGRSDEELIELKIAGAIT